MTVSPRIYYGILCAGAMSLAAFALCVTAGALWARLLGWAVYWLAALVVGVTT